MIYFENNRKNMHRCIINYSSWKYNITLGIINPMALRRNKSIIVWTNFYIVIRMLFYVHLYFLCRGKMTTTVSFWETLEISRYPALLTLQIPGSIPKRCTISSNEIELSLFDHIVMKKSILSLKKKTLIKCKFINMWLFKT